MRLIRRMLPSSSVGSSKTPPPEHHLAENLAQVDRTTSQIVLKSRDDAAAHQLRALYTAHKPGLWCKEATCDHVGSCSCYVCKRSINVGDDFYYKSKPDGTHDTELCQRCAANQLRAQGISVADVEVPSAYIVRQRVLAVQQAGDFGFTIPGGAKRYEVSPDQELREDCSLCCRKTCALSFESAASDPGDDEWRDGDVYFITENSKRLLPDLFHKTCFKYWAFGSGLCTLPVPR